jgi:hypothetical protein
MKKVLIVTGLAAGLLGGGLGVAGVAQAHDRDNGEALTEEQRPASDTTRGERDGDRRHGPGFMGAQRNPRGGGDGVRPGRRGEPLQGVADAIGVPVEDVRRGLADGKSMAQIAADNGVEANEVIDALTGKARERITEMVNRTPGERAADTPQGEPGN